MNRKKSKEDERSGEVLWSQRVFLERKLEAVNERFDLPITDLRRRAVEDNVDQVTSENTVSLDLWKESKSGRSLPERRQRKIERGFLLVLRINELKRAGSNLFKPKRYSSGRFWFESWGKEPVPEQVMKLTESRYELIPELDGGYDHTLRLENHVWKLEFQMEARRHGNDSFRRSWICPVCARTDPHHPWALTLDWRDSRFMCDECHRQCGRNGFLVHPSVISLHGNYKELESCDLRTFAHRMRPSR